MPDFKQIKKGSNDVIVKQIEFNAQKQEKQDQSASCVQPEVVFNTQNEEKEQEPEQDKKHDSFDQHALVILAVELM